MTAKQVTHKSWKPGVSQLNTFEETYSNIPAITKYTDGEITPIANESVKAADLAILKMLNIW